ncbi:MAG: hydrogenase maturation protease [Dehalococcoidales bacterium]|nr:hydrogenase maturation protease [Dehalococcoidales bacterium]
MDYAKSTLVIGLGNMDYGDDSIGPQVARIIADRVHRQGITIIETSDAGLDFLDLLADYDKAIIIDAFRTHHGEVGSIYRAAPETLASQNSSSPHSINFLNAIELGKSLNLPLPDEIIIYGIEAGDISQPGNRCTPEVEDAIPVCVEQVLKELN